MHVDIKDSVRYTWKTIYCTNNLEILINVSTKFKYLIWNFIPLYKELIEKHLYRTIKPPPWSQPRKFWQLRQWNRPTEKRANRSPVRIYPSAPLSGRLLLRSVVEATLSTRSLTTPITAPRARRHTEPLNSSPPVSGAIDSHVQEKSRQVQPSSQWLGGSDFFYDNGHPRRKLNNFTHFLQPQVSELRVPDEEENGNEGGILLANRAENKRKKLTGRKLKILKRKCDTGRAEQN